MSQPTPPELSRQKRLEGHAKSLELRRDRRELKRHLSKSTSPHATLLSVAFDFDIAQGMKVYDLLLALPYIGPKKADALLLAAGIVGGAKGHEYPDRRKTVRACGPKQRERLFGLLQR